MANGQKKHSTSSKLYSCISQPFMSVSLNIGKPHDLKCQCEFNVIELWKKNKLSGVKLGPPALCFPVFIWISLKWEWVGHFESQWRLDLFCLCVHLQWKYQTIWYIYCNLSKTRGFKKWTCVWVLCARSILWNGQLMMKWGVTKTMWKHPWNMQHIQDNCWSFYCTGH